MISDVKEALIVLWIHLTNSSILQIYAVSALALLVGLIGQVRSRALRFSHLDDVPLSRIERTHPHLPSFQTVLLITFSYGVLGMVILALTQQIPAFTNGYHWLQFLCILTLAGSVSILGELKHKRARSNAFAVTLGTSVALLFLLFRPSSGIGTWAFALISFFFLLPVTLISAHVLKREFRPRLATVTIASALLWLVWFTW